jgi:hypothetical protein
LLLFRHRSALANPLLLMLFAVGCAGKDQPVKVTGKVTLDGRPVEGATVTFIPEKGNGRPAIAWTTAEGTFDLTTFRGNDGALRGTYKILVSKTGNANRSGTSTPAEAPTTPKLSATDLPALYGEFATTPFSCTVPTNGPVVLELQSKGR